MCPEFTESLGLATIANPLWRSYLKKHFDTLTIDVISEEHNQKYQDKKWGDFIIITDAEGKDGRYYTVETKTRAEKFYWKYLVDKKIAFEIMGNIQLSKMGSRLLDCRADLWANGYLINNNTQLVEQKLFWIKPLKEWFLENQDKFFTYYSNTGSYYNTRFKLVSLQYLRPFIFNPLFS